MSLGDEVKKKKEEMAKAKAPPEPPPGEPPVVATSAVPTPTPPTLTSDNLPGPAVEQHAPAPAEDERIVARPLVTPDLVNVQPKDRNWIFRWGNRVAGGVDNKGQRIEQLKAMGFFIAKPVDVLNCPESFKKNDQVVYGDLLLMKMSRAKYLGALKYNEQQALARLGPGAATRAGKADLERELAASGVPPSVRGKIQVFTPSKEEAERLAES